MKLKSLIVLLVLGVGFIVLAFSGIGARNLIQLGNQLKTSSSQAEQYAKALNVSRQVQVNFQRQVQEWKNILIRGNEKESYDKYLSQFIGRETNVQDGLVTLRSVFANLKLDPAPIDALATEHRLLGEKYREALATFDAGDKETGKKVDRLLRGIDRPASKAMDALGDQIESEATARLAAARSDAEAFTSERLVLFGAMAILAVVVTVSVCWKIGSNILKLIGAEPADLVDTFGKLAKGDLTQNIAVREDDETSLAAQAKLMQMRVRAMVISMKQGVAEFSAAADHANSGETVAAVQDSLREARKSILALAKAADRFKVGA